MPLNLGQHFTTQFYDFELRGRGWYVAPFPVQLEPHFHPFFGFQYPQAYIDDGKKETPLSKFAGFFKPKPVIPGIAQYESPPYEWFPFTDTAPLAGFKISFPKNARPTAELMEQCFIMLSGIREPISFEIIGEETKISIQLVFRAPYGAYIRSQVLAFFPDVILIPLQDTDTLIDPDLSIYTVDFGLEEECMRPINIGRTHTEPYTALFGILDGLREDERVIVQVLLNGTANAWAESMERVVSDGHGGSFFYDAPDMPRLAQEKTGSPLFAVAFRVLTQAQELDAAYSLLEQVAFAVSTASQSPHNALVPLPEDGYTLEQRMEDIALRQSHRVGMLLNSKELCTLAHFPNSQLSKKLHAYNRTTKAAPASLIGVPYVLGINSHYGTEVSVGINEAQRTRHVHLIGVSGSGKTTMLHNLMMNDVLSGAGLCCIDPHGDLIDTIVQSIPAHRIKDVVLIDPSDSEFPVAFNILGAHSDLEKELLASDLVALFKRFSTSWGDQMNSVFANAVSAFVYNTTTGHLGDLRKFLIDADFRNRMLATCTDPDIVYYWHREYPILKSSSVGSILTRLDSFLRPRVLRQMVCQTEGLNFQQLMDTRKIVLVKLSHGLIGEENSYLLGAFIVSKLQQTAMARQAQQASDRVLFTCYIDEFQHFITPSMNSILSGGRKFLLSLVLAHQELQQLAKTDNDIASALLANAATRVCFKLSDSDAKRMQEGFSAFSTEDLQNLAIGEAIVRVNTKEQDFNIAVVPHANTENSYTEEIIAHSRQVCSVRSGPSDTQPSDEEPQAAPPPQKAPPPVPPQPVPEPAADSPPPTEVREHRYLQMSIKTLAESHGYKANIEAPTPDGQGLIDVLLEKGGQHIAVEISVTTPASWELHNIKKCLAAGYLTVVCTTTAAKKTAIQKRISSALTSEEQSKVSVITKDQIHTLFTTSDPQQSETTYKGYKVKVEYGQSNNDIQQNILQRIMNAKK
ncbi:type IV secretion system DNA-binding domain-containing protein [Mucilaginibacter sp. HMF5004]|uniref:type IV secretory system conjugative DNA transfer family protein n=1 Tax=Mucilaginibacter rivuli TaxID=2857527 RepID=UPI001C6017E3|nr:type IV secretion system DNA-binding domain-containing protein [Mucilaginibacter rivuli]MBW4891117.1 type IV secretion system DNA-binding domain-containing protein [Mucilaginibacter rivuli]